MSVISNNSIAQAIYLAIKDKNSSEQSFVFSKIVQFLNRKRLLSKAPDILIRLNKIINKEEGRIVAKISSVEKIDEKTKKELAQTLAKRYSAKEVSLIENLDEKLLGGIKIEVNDEVIDLTIKNRIEKLQEYLTKTS
jgi:F-type H+-transporting ATPase subunit delta